MGYCHSVTFATVRQAKLAMPTIQGIDKGAELDGEIAPYEEQDVEQDILFNTEEKLTVQQMEIIQGLNLLKVSLDNPDD